MTDRDLMTLRDLFPFKPYELAYWNGTELVEVISYPFPDAEDEISINVRTRISDPTSMMTTKARLLSKTQSSVLGLWR
jgi:hypothetical protein